MKKEKLFAVSIALLMLFGVMSCSNEGSSNSEKESPPSTSEKLSIAHDVMVQGGEGAYVHMNQLSALEGEAMEVTVVMTDPQYLLKSVKLGDQLLNSQVDPENPRVTRHGFLMPDEDARIIVDTFVPTKDHLIHFEENGLVEVEVN